MALELITVVNICSIAHAPDLPAYIRNIRHLLEQKEIDQKLVISSCETANADLKVLHKEFGDKVSFCITQETRTVNVTFNRACELAARAFEMPRGFLYCDSGCDIGTDTLALKRLFTNHRLGNWAMSAGLTDSDTGFELWRPGMTEDQLFVGDCYEVPIGSTVNLHFQIFDRSIVNAFGRPVPDIFRDFCTESVFSFMCAAVTRSFAVWRNVRFSHAHGLDGGASGFQDNRGWRSLLAEAPRKMEDIIADPEALACGFGYEECEKILMHDPTLYTKSGVLKQELRLRLRKFIKDNLFLPKERFDYEAIKTAWISQGKEFLAETLPEERKFADISKLENRAGFRAFLDSQGLTGPSALVTGKDAIAKAKAYASGTLDAVFLDSDRDYRAVLETIDAWWPLVKRGGIIAGAGFSDKASIPNFDNGRNAVTRWFSERQVQYRVLADDTWLALRRW